MPRIFSTAVRKPTAGSAGVDGVLVVTTRLLRVSIATIVGEGATGVDADPDVRSLLHHLGRPGHWFMMRMVDPARQAPRGFRAGPAP